MDNLETTALRIFISDVILNARLVTKLSLYEVSRKLNIDPIVLANYEQGREPVPCYVVAQIIKEYNIPEYLFLKRLTYLTVCKKSSDR